MKRLSRLLAIALLILTIAADAGARTFVLSVGVSTYKDPDVRDLKRSGKDAIAFSKIMKSQTDDVTTVTSANATHDNVVALLGGICKQAQYGDRIVFFFSGHGHDGFILAHDRPVYYKELSRLFNSTKASEIVCFIDACFAGTVADDLRASDKDLVYFLSCRPDEMSMEAPDWIGAGYLTQAMTKGLRGKADDNHDLQVTVIELFKYVYNDVVARVEQANRYLDDNTEPISQHPQLIAAKRSMNLVVTDWR